MSQGDQTADDSSIERKVREQIDADLLESARDAGLDPDGIIETQVSKNAKYGVETITRFAQTAIQREVEAEKAETVEGILMGSRDRYNANWPRRHSLVRSNGEHMEVSTWGGTIDHGDGQEIDIPVGSTGVTMRVDYDDEYDSYEMRRIEDLREFGSDELVEALDGVAIDPSEITEADEYTIQVVRGRIAFINTQTLFEDGEPAGEGDVLMEDERGELHPHFEAVVAGEDDSVTFRAHAGRQANGRPYYNVPDLMMLCEDAVEQYRDPEGQAEFVGTGLRDTEVFAIGAVSGYERDRDGDGNPVTYVDMNLSALVARDQPTTLNEFDAVDETDENEPDDDSSDNEQFECLNDGCDETFETKKARDGHMASHSSDDEDGDDADQPPTEEVADVRESIETYCEITDESIDEITVADVNERLSGVDAEDFVIRAALNLDGNTDDSGDEAEGESGWDAEQALKDADLHAAGTFTCPADGCHAQSGSHTGLLGHAKDAHDAAEYDSPEAWLRDALEA